MKFYLFFCKKVLLLRRLRSTKSSSRRFFFCFPTKTTGFRFRRVRKTGFSDNLLEEHPDDDPGLGDRQARQDGASQPWDWF
jgi:hypothetical protein